MIMFTFLKNTTIFISQFKKVSFSLLNFQGHHKFNLQNLPHLSKSLMNTFKGFRYFIFLKK